MQATAAAGALEAMAGPRSGSMGGYGKNTRLPLRGGTVCVIIDTIVNSKVTLYERC